MKRTGAGVLRKRPADSEAARKSDRVPISLAEMIKRIQENAVVDYVTPTEFILNCSVDDVASDFADDIIDW